MAEKTKTGPQKSGTKKSTIAKAKKTPVKKQTAVEKRLITKLNEILPNLNEEELTFLCDQANTILYNRRIEEIAEQERKKALQQRTEAKKKEHSGIQIVRGDNSHVYHIICNGKYSMFNDEEMLSIIRICHAEDSDNDIKARLYHWFFIERRDFLGDNGLAIDDPEFEQLITIVKKQFKLEMPS